jgi:hypothetical protein
MESSTTQYNPWDEQDADDMDLMSTQSFDTSSAGYFCFQLFSWEDHTSGMMFYDRLIRKEPETWFLILRRSLSGDTFERIGIGSSHARDDRGNWIEVENRSFKVGNTSIKEMAYKCLLFEGCEVKTIKIV